MKVTICPVRNGETEDAFSVELDALPRVGDKIQVSAHSDAPPVDEQDRERHDRLQGNRYFEVENVVWIVSQDIADPQDGTNFEHIRIECSYSTGKHASKDHIEKSTKQQTAPTTPHRTPPKASGSPPIAP